MNRRDWLVALPSLLMLSRMNEPQAAGFAEVRPDHIIRFPDDEGAHPEFRTEWWYITGWLNERHAPLGFQITFFRSRPHPDSGNPSRFDPREIIIAHAAVSERSHGRLRHAQRVARAGFGLAQASTARMDVKIDDWRLNAEGNEYKARIAANDIELNLGFQRTQSPLLQGDRGYSRKGSSPRSASYYYSHPHLATAGTLRAGKRVVQVRGTAWMDHEWSSEYLAADAVGWDWIGINFDDGAALMAFRMRTSDGTSTWASGTYRSAAGELRTFASEDVRWTALRKWRSPRTGADYPVAMQVKLAESTYDIEPLFDDQENDARITTGAVYWEGAVIANRSGQRVGRGYLELTGYAGRLRL